MHKRLFIISLVIGILLVPAGISALMLVHETPPSVPIAVVPKELPSINRFGATDQYGQSATTIVKGYGVAIRWDVTGANYISIDHGFGAISPSGYRWINPLVTTTYTLIATNEGGSTNRSITITVLEKPPDRPEVSFSADRTSITLGESSTLTWNVTGATDAYISFYIDNFPSKARVDPSGTRIVTPTKTTSYILIAENLGGGNTREVTITVHAGASTPPVIQYFGRGKPYIGSEGEIIYTLEWIAEGADSLSISRTSMSGATKNFEVEIPANLRSYTMPLVVEDYYRFILTAKNSYGSTTATFSLTVQLKPHNQ